MLQFVWAREKQREKINDAFLLELEESIDIIEDLTANLSDFDRIKDDLGLRTSIDMAAFGRRLAQNEFK